MKLNAIRQLIHRYQHNNDKNHHHHHHHSALFKKTDQRIQKKNSVDHNDENIKLFTKQKYQKLKQLRKE